MLTVKDLLERAKVSMNDSAYKDFALNTIKTCGYNSNTFDLIKNLNSSFRTQKYKDSIIKNINECSKENGAKDKIIDELGNSYQDLLSKIDDKISKEELDGILFDANIEMVDEYVQYNKISGKTIEGSMENYMNIFASGVDKIDNSPDYVQIKNDLSEDAGISQRGLENLENDTSIFEDDVYEYETETIENEKELSM